MTEGTLIPASEIVHEIRYNRRLSSVYNRDFKGEGQLVIRPDGPTYLFRGRPRGWFAGRSAELTLGPDDIADVTMRGAAITFKAYRGRSGRIPGMPFAFHARDEAEAREIVSLLPKRIDEATAATRDFGTKLRALGGATSPWRSVTYAIIALNVIVYVVMGLLGGGWIDANTMTFIRYGANNGAATTDGEWWRLLTAMFMHYGLIHLALNMWALWQAGQFAERLFGRRLFALLYLASGLTGGFATIFWHGDKMWSVGASGAVFGVIGSLFGFSLRQRQSIPAPVVQSLTRSTLVFVGYNLFYGFVHSGIDNAAHLGGLAGGVLFGWLLALPADRAVRDRLTGSRLALGTGVLVVIVAAGVGLSPRYDYRVRDALAFDAANEEFSGREAALLKQNADGLNHVENAGQAKAHAAWLESDLIPFYTGWDHRLASLDLAPAKSTGRTRARLVAVLDERLASYQHLSAALRANSPDAIKQFVADDAEVTRKIEALAPGKSP